MNSSIALKLHSFFWCNPFDQSLHTFNVMQIFNPRCYYHLDLVAKNEKKCPNFFKIFIPIFQVDKLLVIPFDKCNGISNSLAES